MDPQLLFLSLAVVMVPALATQTELRRSSVASAERENSARLSEIIQNVRANESIYENLEVVRAKSYRLANFGGAPPRAASSIASEARFVYQDGLLYVKNDENLRGTDGKDYNQGFLEGYDGRSTRVVEQGVVANIRDDRIEELRLFRPHCVCIQIHFPLSTFLTGGEATRKHPWYRNSSITAQYVEDELSDNLRCHKVRIELKPDTWKPEDGAQYWYLWLAVDRNYLPIRSEGYLETQKDGDPPIETGLVDDLREIAPGVWFPFYARIDAYDIWRYRTQKEHVLMGSTELTVSKAALDPNYDISLFRDIPIPNGAQVHIIENGVTVRSYTQGGRHTISPPRAMPWQWPAIGIVLVGALFIGGYLRYRQRRNAA